MFEQTHFVPWVNQLFLIVLIYTYFQGRQCIGQWNMGERWRESSCDIWWRTCARWKRWSIPRCWWKEIVSPCLLCLCSRTILIFCFLSIRYVSPSNQISYLCHNIRSAYSILATRMMIVNGLCRLLNQSNAGIQLCEFFFWAVNERFGNMRKLARLSRMVVSLS